MTTNLKHGSSGDEVKQLQEGLVKLGYDITPDGKFGPKTEDAVKSVQTLFGYTVDGIAGDGTQKLVTAQIGHGWSLKLPNFKDLALAAQGKAPPPVLTPEQEKAAAVAKANAMASAPAKK